MEWLNIILYTLIAITIIILTIIFFTESNIHSTLNQRPSIGKIYNLRSTAPNNEYINSPCLSNKRPVYRIKILDVNNDGGYSFSLIDDRDSEFYLIVSQDSVIITNDDKAENRVFLYENPAKNYFYGLESPSLPNKKIKPLWDKDCYSLKLIDKNAPIGHYVWNITA